MLVLLKISKTNRPTNESFGANYHERTSRELALPLLVGSYFIGLSSAIHHHLPNWIQLGPGHAQFGNSHTLDASADLDSKF